MVSDLFQENRFTFAYVHDDRLLLGGATLVGSPLALEAPDELAAEYFLERRELGIVGIDGDLVVTADDQVFALGPHDVLYLPCGVRDVTIDGTGTCYLVSSPAYRATTATLARASEVEALHLGNETEANERIIRKYIHADGIESNQLVLGITTLAEGSVWNTMPAHVHERRTEAYLYFGLGEAPLVHLMGQPHNTRHLILKDRDVAISPPWSIHSGSGVAAYSFVWAMAGENIDYTDVSVVDPQGMR